MKCWEETLNTSSGHLGIWQAEAENDSQAVPAPVSKTKLFVTSNDSPNDASHYRRIAEAAKI